MEKKNVTDKIDVLATDVVSICRKIWNNPEISEHEIESANYYRTELKNKGFDIHEIEGQPNAFYAEYGEGYPVIGLLGEYDALSGLSQKVDCKMEAVSPGGPGHGCGHNLLGGACFGATVAIKEYLSEKGIAGTIRFYGCPEEETLCGKVKMIKAKAFDSCDVVLSWHPYNANACLRNSYLANNSIKFRFHGVSAHAGINPHLGRSALDAVELMNVGANYLREHIIDQARVHYTITKAGLAPNIIPDEAEVWYYVRAPHRKDVEEITGRLIKISEGAALMTETNVEVIKVSGCYEMLSNDVMHELTYKNMIEIPTPVYTSEEIEFAKSLQATLNEGVIQREINNIGIDINSQSQNIHDFVASKDKLDALKISSSSDSGDVSWIKPMNLLITACWPIGINAHTWQATAASGSTIGEKGMLYASKIMTGVIYDLLNDNSIVEKAKMEFNERTNNNKYVFPM